MGSAPITQALIDQVRAVFPKAAISNGYGTTEAGPVVFGPHPKGIPQPELSTGYPHPEVAAAPGARRQGSRERSRGELEMKCGALMTHYHKLPEATAKAMTPDGYYRTSDVFRRDENGFFYLRRPRRRHVRVRRREHLSRRGREDAGDAIPASTRPPSSRCPTS